MKRPPIILLKINTGKNLTNPWEWAIHYIKNLWKNRKRILRWTTFALHPSKIMRKGKKNTWKKKTKKNETKVKIKIMSIYGVLSNLCPFFQDLLKLCLNSAKAQKFCSNYAKLIMLHRYYAKVILLCPSMSKFSTFLPFMLNLWKFVQVMPKLSGYA